jgi:hypothetical protein
MAKLTAAARRRLPKSDFALPGGRFPLNNASHDRAAISGASRALHAGTISSGQAKRIVAAARRKLNGK